MSNGDFPDDFDHPMQKYDRPDGPPNPNNVYNTGPFAGSPRSGQRRDVRWGGQDSVTIAGIAGIATGESKQFLDWEIEEPRSVRLRLEAFAEDPVAGLGVIFVVSYGAGSTMVQRQITGTVANLVTIAATEIDFAARKLLVRASLTNGQGIDRTIFVNAFAAPWGYAYGEDGAWRCK